MVKNYDVQIEAEDGEGRTVRLTEVASFEVSAEAPRSRLSGDFLNLLGGEGEDRRCISEEVREAKAVRQVGAKRPDLKNIRALSSICQ